MHTSTRTKWITGGIVLLILLVGVGLLVWVLTSNNGNNGSACSQSDSSSCDANEWCDATGICQDCNCTSSSQHCDFSSGKCLCSHEDQRSCGANQWCDPTSATCNDCDCASTATCEFTSGACICDKGDSSSCKTGQWCDDDRHCEECDCRDGGGCGFSSGGCCDAVTDFAVGSGSPKQLPVTWTWPKNNASDITCTLQMVGQNSGCTDDPMTVDCASEQATYPFHTDSIASDMDYSLTLTATGGPCASEGNTVTAYNQGWQVWQDCETATDCIGYQAGVTTCDAPGCMPGQCQTLCHNVSCKT